MRWRKTPEGDDFDAAFDYLELLYPPEEARRIVHRLRDAPLVVKKAKDIMRASRLPLLPADDAAVAKDLQAVRDGRKLSPVLLVRGLIVADGYHRVCAAYHVDEDAEVSAVLA